MKRSKFSLSNYKLLTGEMGKLMPIGLMEVLPGDTVQQATSLLLRTQPLVAPVMHPVHVRVHHFYVPNRLVWDHWDKFITNSADPELVLPFVDLPAVTKSSLANYLGIPTGYAGVANALPFRAYNMIYNEFFRDQDLQPLAVIDTGDGTAGEDSTTELDLLNCAWEKDYFTTARPWTQKGDEATIGLGGTVPVSGTITKAARDEQFRSAANGAGTAYQMSVNSNNVQASGAPDQSHYIHSPSQALTHSLTADLAQSTAVTINELRTAFALQRFAEARAKYGSRYTEYLRYLGVKSSDSRLDRPEYLGGGKQTIQFSEVLQTGPDQDGTGVGELLGHGIAAMRSNRYRRYFEEHGFVISLLSVKPKTIYAQALPRMWSRETYTDFFQPELQGIGQQEVKNKEIYATSANPDVTFGYQDRYDEYKRIESTVCGGFESNLDYWHLARVFAAQPTLNEDFIKSTPSDRIFAASATDSLIVMANHSIQARRIVKP